MFPITGFFGSAPNIYFYISGFDCFYIDRKFLEHFIHSWVRLSARFAKRSEWGSVSLRFVAWLSVLDRICMSGQSCSVLNQIKVHFSAT